MKSKLAFVIGAIVALSFGGSLPADCGGWYYYGNPGWHSGCRVYHPYYYPGVHVIPAPATQVTPAVPATPATPATPVVPRPVEAPSVKAAEAEPDDLPVPEDLTPADVGDSIGRPTASTTRSAQQLIVRGNQ